MYQILVLVVRTEIHIYNIITLGTGLEASCTPHRFVETHCIRWVNKILTFVILFVATWQKSVGGDFLDVLTNGNIV